MLKHFLLPALAASVCISSSAQSPVDLTQNEMGYTSIKILPGAYMANGESVFYYGGNNDTGLWTFDILNNDATIREKIQFQSPKNIDSTPNIYYYIYDLTDGKNCSETTVHFTQTLFNSDNDYEFLVPIYGSETIEYMMTTIYKTIGYKIVNTKGVELYTFLFPEKQYTDIMGGDNVYVFSDKIVFIFNTTEDDPTQVYGGIYHTLAYVIDRNGTGANKNVKLASDRIVVAPTLLTNREPVNVELGYQEHPCSITVFSATGAMVYNTMAPAGTDLITIPANTLPHGMNIVHITDGKSINQSTKLIIR